MTYHSLPIFVVANPFRLRADRLSSLLSYKATLPGAALRSFLYLQAPSRSAHGSIVAAEGGATRCDFFRRRLVSPPPGGVTSPRRFVLLRHAAENRNCRRGRPSARAPSIGTLACSVDPTLQQFAFASIPDRFPSRYVPMTNDAVPSVDARRGDVRDAHASDVAFAFAFEGASINTSATDVSDPNRTRRSETLARSRSRSCSCSSADDDDDDLGEDSSEDWGGDGDGDGDGVAAYHSSAARETTSGLVALRLSMPARGISASACVLPPRDCEGLARGLERGLQPKAESPPPPRADPSALELASEAEPSARFRSHMALASSEGAEPRLGRGTGRGWRRRAPEWNESSSDIRTVGSNANPIAGRISTDDPRLDTPSTSGRRWGCGAG